MKEEILYRLIRAGMGEVPAMYIMDAAILLALFVLCVIADYITRRVLLSMLSMFIHKSRLELDDRLIQYRVLSRLAHLVPALIVYVISPASFDEFPLLVGFLTNASLLYMIVVGILVAFSLLDVVNDMYTNSELAKHFPVKGIIQAAKLISFLIGIIFAISTLTNRAPLYLLSGLGALTAVLLLVFKDAILGLVAGIQLSVNDMVAEGDWIEMPQYGADGEVIDVSLTTVKVQNWDKTISNIPSYALISSSFKNWRGMTQSGGRRIKRSINIDMSSIRFCDDGMIERLSRIQYLADYIGAKNREIVEYNKVHGVDDTSLVNGRRMTNVGTFRAYVVEYLRHRPEINQNMTFMVRHLDPTELGLPIQVYVFCSEKRWAHYESIQADIFDHLLAVVPEFGLRVFQSPSGTDIARAAQHLK